MRIARLRLADDDDDDDVDDDGHDHDDDDDDEDDDDEDDECNSTTMTTAIYRFYVAFFNYNLSITIGCAFCQFLRSPKYIQREIEGDCLTN